MTEYICNKCGNRSRAFFCPKCGGEGAKYIPKTVRGKFMKYCPYCKKAFNTLAAAKACEEVCYKKMLNPGKKNSKNKNKQGYPQTVKIDWPNKYENYNEEELETIIKEFEAQKRKLTKNMPKPFKRRMNDYTFRKLSTQKKAAARRKLRAKQQNKIKYINEELRDAKGAMRMLKQQNPDNIEFAQARRAFGRNIKEVEGVAYRGDFQTHHLVPVSIHPEKAFEEWNGVPIPGDWHREFHSLMGGTHRCRFPEVFWATEFVEFLYNKLGE